jgi:hypothetical protein
MCKNFNTERVMRWRLVLKEYSPELRYIKGEHNIVADALSRLDMVPEPREQGEQMDDDEIAMLFAAAEDDYPTKFPLSYQEIENRQKADEEIKKLLRGKSSSTNRPDSTLATPNTHWSHVTARLLSRKHSRNLESSGITNYLCTQAKHILSS